MLDVDKAAKIWVKLAGEQPSADNDDFLLAA